MLKENITACILVALVIGLANPFHLWMPSMAHFVMLAGAFAAFAAYAVFILREKALDERDDAHRMIAGRSAFLAGAGVLLLGIFVQSGHHEIDLWLVYSLAAMIFAKFTARWYSDSQM